MTCFVYFVQAGAGESGAIKIGYSADVEKRVAQLQTGNHLPLRVLAKFDLGDTEAAVAFEHEMHVAFLDLSLEGEWFAYDARILDVIDALRVMDGEARFPQGLADRLGAAGEDIAVDVFGPGGSPGDPRGQYVVEWSPSQGRTHLAPLSDAVGMAYHSFIVGESPANDYVIVAICASSDDARRLAEIIEPTLRAVRIAHRAGASRAFAQRQKGDRR